MFITKSWDNLTSTRRAGAIDHSTFVIRHLNRTTILESSASLDATNSRQRCRKWKMNSP